MRSRFAAILAALLLAGSAFPAGAATAPKPARPRAPASFDVQGTVDQVSKGWFDLSVDRVFRGRLSRGAHVRVLEAASTRFLKAGKVIRAEDLKRGLRVRVAGQVRGSGKHATYTAATVTLLP